MSIQNKNKSLNIRYPNIDNHNRFYFYLMKKYTKKIIGVKNENKKI